MTGDRVHALLGSRLSMPTPVAWLPGGHSRQVPGSWWSRIAGCSRRFRYRATSPDLTNHSYMVILKTSQIQCVASCRVHGLPCERRSRSVPPPPPSPRHIRRGAGSITVAASPPPARPPPPPAARHLYLAGARAAKAAARARARRGCAERGAEFAAALVRRRRAQARRRARTHADTARGDRREYSVALRERGAVVALPRVERAHRD
jgi:hypothetical protein